MDLKRELTLKGTTYKDVFDLINAFDWATRVMIISITHNGESVAHNIPTWELCGFFINDCDVPLRPSPCGREILIQYIEQSYKEYVNWDGISPVTVDMIEKCMITLRDRLLSGSGNIVFMTNSEVFVASDWKATPLIQL